MITISELVAATMIVTGFAVRYAAGALLCIAVGGIILIHRNFGWFVGEHATGGSEYSVALIALLAAIAASDLDTTRAIKNENA
jgi:putative oxidoreductase